MRHCIISILIDVDGNFLLHRGLDNRVYYMLAPKGQYYNYSGCGNTMNCNHPQVRQFILECLQYWVLEMHVDGFRFDLASIMTRAPSLWHDSEKTVPASNGTSEAGFEADETPSPGEVTWCYHFH